MKDINGLMNIKELS